MSDKEILSPEKRLTNEQRYDISQQPAETCPLIDLTIALVERSMKAIKGYERMDESELRNACSDVESLLSELLGYRRDGRLEEIRNANIAIRDWGQQWKELALEHAPEPAEEAA